MTAPVWITPPGDLGTVVEGEFYQAQLTAQNTVAYAYLSGTLPSGIRVTRNGSVEGAPKNYDYIQGVPKEVSQDVTNKFVVRATSADGTVADRVFQMTITGQDAPVIDTTPDSNLGAYFDGDIVNVQLTAVDPDPGDILTWSLFSGDIPAGVTVSASGLISGYIEPFAAINGVVGFDNVNFDMVPFDFRTVSEDRNYQFTVQVSDTKDIDTRTFSLYAASRNIVTADLEFVTADNDSSTVTDISLNSLLDASQSSLRNPALLTAVSELGTYDHDNYFNFQFIAKDFDGDPVEFVLTGTLPPGVTLDAASGWLSGYVPATYAIETAYNFTIQVRKTGNIDYASPVVSYTIKVIGDIDSTVAWPNTMLGTISTGEVSQLNVIATINGGSAVQYELKSGQPNRLPQGLMLNQNGLLIGRVSFEKTMFDTGTTTFDKDLTYINETTFESDYTFSVRVFSTDGTVDTYKQFTITVVPSTLAPYESVYARVLAPIDQRNIYSQLIQNIDDIPPGDVYRSSDFNFGIRKDLRALIAAGLTASPVTDYIEAMSKNFYNNTLRFEGYKTAQALNTDGTVKYEVVYVELVDNMQGIHPVTGVSASPVIKQNVRSAATWTNPLDVSEGWPKVSAGHYLTSQINDYYAYPNSISNMRSRLTSDIGYSILERKVLPDWMIDKQPTSDALGWILVCPLVFCKPGTSAKIKYRLENRTSSDLKLISFEIDRFILDNNLSKNYDTSTGSYPTSAETSFDIATSITEFDGDGTRFIAAVDMFALQDAGDVYIKFPQVGVFR